MKSPINSDGVLVNTLHDTGHTEITGVLTQPGRERILRLNQELQKNPDVQKDLTFGRLVANIPELDFLHLSQKYPGIADYSNPRARRKEMLRVLSLPECRKYLVRPKKRGRV